MKYKESVFAYPNVAQRAGAWSRWYLGGTEKGQRCLLHSQKGHHILTEPPMGYARNEIKWRGGGCLIT